MVGGSPPMIMITIYLVGTVVKVIKERGGITAVTTLTSTATTLCHIIMELDGIIFIH